MPQVNNLSLFFAKAALKNSNIVVIENFAGQRMIKVRYRYLNKKYSLAICHVSSKRRLGAPRYRGKGPV